MNLLLVMMSLLSAVALTATAVSLFALQRACRLVREAHHSRGPVHATDNPELQSLRDSVQLLAAQVQEIPKSSATLPEPGAARPGMNLTKRSQALRMHRRGENLEQIATALAVPRQEVDLLIKVHRIVMSNV
jgi:hypothetical protein